MAATADVLVKEIEHIEEQGSRHWESINHAGRLLVVQSRCAKEKDLAALEADTECEGCPPHPVHHGRCFATVAVGRAMTDCRCQTRREAGRKLAK